MDPFIIGGGIVALGNAIGGLFQSSAQDRANEANRQMAYENRMWQQEMSSTAYQRAATDMKAAGLNPIMSVNPASSPSGSVSQDQAANPLQGVGPGLAQGMNSAMNIMQTEADVKSKSAQAALNQASIATEAAKQQQATASAKQANATAAQLEAELPGKAERAKLNKEQSKIDLNMLEYDNVMNRVQQGVGIGASAADMINPLKGLFKGKSSSGWSGKSKDLFDYMNRRRTE